MTTKAENFERLGRGEANECHSLESFGHQRRKGRVRDWDRSLRRPEMGSRPKWIDQRSEDVVLRKRMGLVDRRPSELPDNCAQIDWWDPLHADFSGPGDYAGGESGNADPHSA